MGISKNQLLQALGVVKGYSNEELSELETRVSALIQGLYEVVNNNREDPIHVLDENVGLQDTPVGHVMAYMGKVAPRHYLACDGAEYEISVFPALAAHILKEFGVVNYFGGDGETTFCVPDLRGEFLRGSGENSHENGGSGAEVGEHQVPTQSPGMYTTDAVSSIVVPITLPKENKPSVIDPDTSIIGNGHFSVSKTSTSSGTALIGRYTSRPTNTSVLYCIKCEPTYYLRAGSNVDYHSFDEICIGIAPNGKPLYRKWLFGIISTAQQQDIVSGGSFGEFPKDIEIIWDAKGVLLNGNTERPVAPIPYIISPTTQLIGFYYTIDADGNLTLNLRRGATSSSSNKMYLCFEYTKLV